MSSSTLTCESDFIVAGMQDGEEQITVVRIFSTCIVLSVTSAWFSVTKIKRLNLFFAHWLSGLVMSAGYMIDDMLVSVCWISSDVEVFIKTLKFIENSASHMLAITNLAICINLALIVLSHRTLNRVKSLSSPRLTMMFLVISMVFAAISTPFWDRILVVGVGFWLSSPHEARVDVINVSMFCVEFVVGICMLLIVAWLLLFRTNEIKECWKMHRRIRFYFILTAIGTAVNLALGICGTIDVVVDSANTPLLVVWSWTFRYVQIALDTMVLYGVLRERSMDERGDGASSGPSGLSSQQRTSRCGTRGGPGGPDHSSKPVPGAPLI